MFKKVVLVAASGVFVQQAYAAGFVENSVAKLTARNFYYNGDNRDGANEPSKQEEWGQGFILDYKSGFTEGTVGVGIDALGLWGIKLDSGRGRSGQLFPSGDDGRAEREFGSLGLTAKARISKTVARVGTLLPKNPVAVYNDGRLLPQTFEGYEVQSNESDRLSLVGGRLLHAKARNSSDREPLSIAGSNKSGGQRSNDFYYAGADYKLGKNLVAQYYYGTLADFYKQHFLGLKHTASVAGGKLITDARYFNSDSDGKNASSEGRLEGYKGSGKDSASTEVDSRVWSLMSTYSKGGHSVGLGYQEAIGDSDMPFLNQGDGSSVYLITNAQIGKFQRAGERTWVAKYGYDFASVGLDGLTASVAYFSGSGVKAAGTGSEWERDLALSYVIQDGSFKGLGVALKSAAIRSGVNSQRGQDRNRIMLSYTLSIL
ncbi:MULTISPECIES: OprD family porin [unclassified Pseudomonas]|uniref:OprD family porin n=1 Tax=unclassified Pseudomonas TaxID=196821 RepID=UPI0038161766